MLYKAYNAIRRHSSVGDFRGEWVYFHFKTFTWPERDSYLKLKLHFPHHIHMDLPVGTPDKKRPTAYRKWLVKQEVSAGNRNGRLTLTYNNNAKESSRENTLTGLESLPRISRRHEATDNKKKGQNLRAVRLKTASNVISWCHLHKHQNQTPRPFQI